MNHSTLTQDITIDNEAIADSSEIPMGEFTSGMIHVPTGSSITSLAWYAAEAPGGTYIPVYNASGAVTQTVAQTKSYQLPTELAGAKAIKALGDAAGTITVVLKN